MSALLLVKPDDIPTFCVSLNNKSAFIFGRANDSISIHSFFVNTLSISRYDNGNGNYDDNSNGNGNDNGNGNVNGNGNDNGSCNGNGNGSGNSNVNDDGNSYSQKLNITNHSIKYYFML